MTNTIKVQLIKSLIGTCKKHRLTVHALGLNRVHSIVRVEDTSAIRGMIKKVFYLVKII